MKNMLSITTKPPASRQWARQLLGPSDKRAYISCPLTQLLLLVPSTPPSFIKIAYLPQLTITSSNPSSLTSSTSSLLLRSMDFCSCPPLSVVPTNLPVKFPWDTAPEEFTSKLPDVPESLRAPSWTGDLDKVLHCQRTPAGNGHGTTRPVPTPYEYKEPADIKDDNARGMSPSIVPIAPLTVQNLHTSRSISAGTSTMWRISIRPSFSRAGATSRTCTPISTDWSRSCTVLSRHLQ